MERSKLRGLVSTRVGLALLLLGVIPFLGLDKAKTDADRARVVEQLERRMKSAQPASSRPGA